jgi:hypothetical protein
MNAARRALIPFFAALLSILAPALAETGGARGATLKKCADVPVPKTNIVMIRKDGEAIDPADPRFALLDETGVYTNYDQRIAAIFADLRKFCAGHPDRPCKVLFYFHGGLNDPHSSVERAQKLTAAIEARGIYPIFVNWDSSLVSTWWDHVAHVHKGLWQEKLFFPFVPYFIAADEVRSIAEAPSA